MKDKLKDLLQLTKLTQALNGGALVKPEEHHEPLDYNVFKIFGLGGRQLIKVHLVEGVDVRPDCLTYVLYKCNYEGHADH